MANLQGYGAAAVGNMLNHYTRHEGDPDQTKYRYANQNIDRTRTHLNYVVGKERADPRAFVQHQIGRADVKPRDGENATNVISDWVITLPKNERLEGREREFFQVAYDHLTERVPEGLVVGAYVHMDENQPHMHFCFVPLARTAVMTNDKSRPLLNKDGSVKRDKKGTVRYKRVPVRGEDGKPVYRTSFAQSKVYDRKAMREFHPALEKAMEKHFGFEVGVQLGEEQKVEKVLSSVPQAELDAVRAAIVGPAEERAAEIVHEAEQKAAERLSEAQARVEALEGLADEEEDRLERLRQRADGVARDVDELRPIAAEVRGFEAAGKREKGSILDSIAARCDGLARRCRAAVARIEQELARVARKAAPRANDMMAQATSAAQAYNEGRYERGEVPEPRRTWSR